MSVIYLVIPIALVLAAAGLGAFLWAVRKGQFDDLDTPAVRMLFDDDDESDGTDKEEADPDGSAK